ncbi:hypothetical protein MHYP_G00243440 [Metynnis hypsauchen]
MECVAVVEKKRQQNETFFKPERKSSRRNSCTNSNRGWRGASTQKQLREERNRPSLQATPTAEEGRDDTKHKETFYCSESEF